jgi:DNA-3-methyladenine glycosylase
LALRPLPRSFFARAAPEVAREILGHVLVRQFHDDLLIGRIVEVEAYRGADDPASHAYRGRTPRNAVMWGPPGHAYVYFTYGNHFCLNLVTESVGQAAAVLLRALEPRQGIPQMQQHRGVDAVTALCSGPGKLTQALGITRTLNGHDLCRRGPLFVAWGDPAEPDEVTIGPRIGIRTGADKAWRFYLAGHPCLSRR